MSTEDLKSLALKVCIDMAADYTKQEVEKFFPEQMQRAWEIGNQYLDEERKKRQGIVKNFTL